MPETVRETALVLLAHGSRDSRWAEPFQRVSAAVRAAAPGLAVELAFLESMTPDLSTSIRSLADAGVTRVRVIPLFLGQGGHLRTDVPAMLRDIEASLSGVEIELVQAAGDNDLVIDALVGFCLSEARRR